MKLNTKLLTITAVFIAALMLLSPISQTNTSGGGGTNNYNLDFLNSLDINNNHFVLSADSLSDSVNINDVKVVEDNGTKKLQYKSDGEEVDKTTFILVSDVDGLKQLSNLVNDDKKPFDFSGYTIKLTENLTLTDPDQKPSNFTPIGKDLSHKFNGTFDGQGHVISNLQVSNVQYAGLFGVLGDKSTIKNLGIINSKISANVENGVAYSGGIAGNNDSGTITNCYNTGNVKATTTNGSAYSGGIAGDNDSGTITNCYNTGAVTASSNSGGIAGNNNGGTITKCYNAGVVTGSTSSGGIAGFNSGKITNCYNTGTVTSSINSGGITGWNNHGTITNCYNTGAVTAESTKENVSSGGIAGYNQGGTITNCYNTGVVSRSTSSGGIAGRNSGTIENCYNTGDVTATADSTSTSTSSSANSGGVAGKNEGTITNCYNTGDVTATADSTSTSTNSSAFSGGVAGFNSGKITNCYNSGTVTGTAISTNSSAYSGGIAGKNVGSTVQSCYSKQNSNPKLIGEGTISDTCKSFDEYGILSGGNKSLLDALNEWVTDNEQNPDKYRYWMDPFIQDEEYPVFTDWYGEAKRLNESLPTPNAEGVYEIKNRYQLALIADMPNGNYVLADDIDLSGYEWRPIGNKTNQFSGTFDGNGHTISNLSVNINSKSGNVYSGLFGYLGSNATVKDLGIINSVIFTNTTYKSDDRAFSGGIVGYNDGGTVTKCYYTGTVIGTGAVTFGGIVGENKNGTVSNCHNTGTVIGTETSGGIVGYSSGTVTNCYNTGVVIADTTNDTANSGGIVGNNGGTVTNCYNTGVVIATTTATDRQAFSGGITGNNYHGTIENCYNTGFVAADSTNYEAFSGGIAGFNSGKITNCYNTGLVIADSTKHFANSGGITGNNNSGTITNCYNTGDVTADSTNYEAYSGGIAGRNIEGTIKNCYNTGDVTATAANYEAYSGGIAGFNSGKITNCYNTGLVIADTTNDTANSGGIVGNNNSGTITNCYNTGVVIATAANNKAYSGGIAGENKNGKITNCYNTGLVIADSTKHFANSGGIVGNNNSGTITNCYNTGLVTADSTNYEAYSGGIAGNNTGEGIKNTFYLKSTDDKLFGIGNTSKDEDSKTKKLTSDNMKELKLLGGEGSTNNLNEDKDGNDITDPKLKPWSPDIFGVNNGYPILADVPTQIDPNSINKPPQSAVYIILDSETAQAENYLEPFMLKNGKEIAATVKYLNNQDKNITSYQWYEMNDEGAFIETNEIQSPPEIIHGTYYVKVTSSDDYSYTSLTRTASNIVTVTFNNDGSDVNKIETYYNETISQPEGLTKTGYAVEWYTSNDNGNTLSEKWNFSSDIVKSDMTLYAKWKLIDYSVEYNGNNNTSGTVPIDNEKYTIGKTINVELNEGNLAKSGHIFRGWNYTPNASSALSSPITLTKDVIEKYIGEGTILNLYAVWTPIPEPIYTLCLNSNDSTLQTKRYSGTYGTEITLKSASDFGWNSECKFIEWNSKSDGSGVSYKEGDKFSLGSDVWNLYAIWSDSSYHTVSFDSNGGNSIPSQSIQDGYRASEPNAPTKQGHSFKHWSLNGTKYDFNQSVKEDTTLKAEYEVISYKVTFYYNGDVYYSTQVDYNTSLGNRMPSLPSDKDSWNTSENGKGSNFTSDSLITSDISIYAVSENSLTSILIIGGSAAVILALIAAWMFMRSRYN